MGASLRRLSAGHKRVEFLGICDNRLALATEWNIFLFNKIAGTALRNFEIVSELLYAS